MREHIDWHAAALSEALKQWYTPNEGELHESMGGIGGIMRRL